MIAFALDVRRRTPLRQYRKLVEDLREKFKGISVSTAYRIIGEADEQLRLEFQRECAGAPRAIFDAYLEIYEEALRQKDLSNARGALDSVRDMFGMRGTINVNVTSGDMPLSRLQPLSDAQIDLLAQLDLDMPDAIDAASIETASAVVDVLDDAGDE